MKLDESLFDDYTDYDDIDADCIKDGMVAVMCDCGYEDIIPIRAYDGCCPWCHGHTGEYGPVPFDEFEESLTEAYDTEVVAKILDGTIPQPKGFKWLSSNGDSGEVKFKGTDYAFRKMNNGTYRVMRSSDAGWNWSETLHKDESLKEEYYINEDNIWKVVEKIKSHVDDGSINKDELIDKLLQWFYLDRTFLPFVVNNGILSKDEIYSMSGIPENLENNKSLKEDIDDVVVIDVPDVIANIKEDEITPKGPELGEDTGVANALLDLINSENSTISDYNGFIATVAEFHPEFIPAIEDIANEENNHVGMLQKLLQQISPNVQTIEQGQLEAEKDLIDDSNDFEVPDFDADDSFDDGFGGIYL